jgi:hypothetical protein
VSDGSVRLNFSNNHFSAPNLCFVILIGPLRNGQTNKKTHLVDI